MKERIELLEKMGFSKDFLKAIENESKIEQPILSKVQITEPSINPNRSYNDLNSLVIPKTNRPQTDFFVFNKK